MSGIKQWKGETVSSYYGKGFVKCVIEIGLDPDSDEYETDFSVYYYGIYRNGQSYEGKVTIKGKEDLSLTIFDDQMVTLSIEDWTATNIAGTYESERPSDKGTFWLVPAENYSATTGNCIIT